MGEDRADGMGIVEPATTTADDATETTMLPTFAGGSPCWTVWGGGPTLVEAGSFGAALDAGRAASVEGVATDSDEGAATDEG